MSDVNEMAFSIIELAAGAVRAWRRSGGLVLRGVPYAVPPVGERRFEPPQPFPSWQGVRDATGEPAVAPQPPSRVAGVVGNSAGRQDEDCLTLDVYTPAADGRARPVLFWVHGGAHTTGAGSVAWHDAMQLALTQDMVVVCPNFRLGALGFLVWPGLTDGNLGLLDQQEALRWVATHIEALGGDPKRVTVAGQSSGAACVAALAAMPSARGLFQRAIIQSAPLGRPERSVDQAAAMGEQFLRLAGIDPDRPAAAKSLTIPQLLDAQKAFGATLSAPLGATPMPFMPVTDGQVLPSLLAPGAEPVCDILIGTTREEMAAFYAVDPRMADVSREAALASLQTLVQDEPAQDVYARYAAQRAGATPAAVLGDYFTDRVFRLPSLAYAERAQRRQPGSVFVYRFDWQSPAGFMACHCLDIPFVFGNLDAWRDAPMLSGLNEAAFHGLSAAMQAAWGAFARQGRPNADGLLPWPAYEPGRNSIMRLDNYLELLPAPAAR